MCMGYYEIMRGCECFECPKIIFCSLSPNETFCNIFKRCREPYNRRRRGAFFSLTDHPCSLLSFFWANEHLGPLVQYVIKWPPLPLLCWLLLAAKFLSASLIHDSSAIIAHSLPDAKKMARTMTWMLMKMTTFITNSPFL